MKSHITAIGTANPGERIPQLDIANFMKRVHQMNNGETERLYALYRASGIRYRYSVIEDYAMKNGQFNFYPNSVDLEPFPSIGKRMEVYRKNALALGLKAIHNCLNQTPDLDPLKITHLITVSCTGFYAPGLDIELIKHLGLKSTVQRTAINYMGCYAAFNAIKIADAICTSQPSAKIMILCIELCSIHFQKGNAGDTILANALFGDGAAAALIESQPRTKSLLPIRFYCDVMTEYQKDMTWQVGDLGFEMKLSSYIPEIIRTGIKDLTEGLLDNLDLQIDQIDYFAIHPGGKRILEVIEQELGLPREKNRFSYQVLKEYGNMSSPTVLFVLKAIWDDLTHEDQDKSILSFAFGPGLTLESMLLKTVS